MGTLFQQPPRERYDREFQDFINIANTLGRISQECNLSFEQAAQVYKLGLEEQRIRIDVMDKDIKDEQLKGFRELWRRHIEAKEFFNVLFREYTDREEEE